MKKRFIAILSLLVIVIMASTVSAFYYDVATTHWAYPVIAYWNDKDIISGYTDGSFMPDKPVTKAEFATIIVRVLEKSKVNILKTNSVEFMDVLQFHWAYDAIQKASPIMHAQYQNRFQPEKEMVREDVAMALYNVLDMSGAIEKANNAKKVSGDNKVSGEKDVLKNLERFTDNKAISENRKKYVANAVEYGLMKGNEDKTFCPQGGVTRAELLQALYNMIHSSYFQGGKDFWKSDEEIQKSQTSKTTTQQTETTNTRKPIEPTAEQLAKTNGSNVSSIALVSEIGEQRLYDGGSYALAEDEAIKVAILNSGDTANFIYYTIAYGNQLQNTIVKKIAAPTTNIVMPENMPEGTAKLTVWGATNKNGKGYMTNTDIYYIRYVAHKDISLVDNGEKYEEQSGIKVADQKVNFIVIYRGENLAENEVVERVKTEHTIIVRGKPVVNMDSIEYKWDNEKNFTKETGATTTIDIPDSFVNGSTHRLTIRITDKQGRTYLARNYNFIINDVLKTETEKKETEEKKTTSENPKETNKTQGVVSPNNTYKQ